MDHEVGSLNRPFILREEEIINIYIEASVLPEKEAFLIDFLHQFNNQREPVLFEGEYFKLELFRRYKGRDLKRFSYNSKTVQKQ